MRLFAAFVKLAGLDTFVKSVTTLFVAYFTESQLLCGKSMNRVFKVFVTLKNLCCQGFLLRICK